MVSAVLDWRANAKETVRERERDREIEKEREKERRERPDRRGVAKEGDERGGGEE